MDKVGLGLARNSIADLIGGSQNRGHPRNRGTAKVRSAETALQSLALHARLLDMLAEQHEVGRELTSWLRETEMPLVRSLADMELRGIKVDLLTLKRLRGPLDSRLEQLDEEARLLAGVGPGNDMNSGQDVRNMLAKMQLALPPPANNGKAAAEGGKEKVIVTKEQLEVLASQGHRIAAVVMEFRRFLKIRNGFVDTIMRHMRESGGGTSGEIRGRFLQTQADTGRLVMDTPNLQTVSKQTVLKLDSALPGGLPEEVAINVREAFVPRDGHVLISADYRQLELRIMAHLSGDEVLVERLRDVLVDPFIAIAAAWNKMPPEAVTPEQRARVKELCYGIIYGMGKVALAKKMGCTAEEADGYASSLLRSLKGVVSWRDRVIEDCRRDKSVTTIGGRRRGLEDISDMKNSAARARAERQAVNTVCQGSAADLVKRAMLELARRLAIGGGRGAGAGAHLLLMIHDELLLEVPESRLHKVVPIVVGAMESVGFGMKVPFPVKVRVGRSWGTLEDYQSGRSCAPPAGVGAVGGG
mmetsp:Transcript_998/g.3833  ORF Transcript_998/g.3833 Transcript_998/m.3833 type:complete len:528 (+) Transcript_998:922-2505(+)